MTAPQWIMAIVLSVQILAALILDGEPRSDANWNGAQLFLSAVATAALLGWGGFWNAPKK
mgnify:CR=1 FL=1